MIDVRHGDSRDVLKTMADASIDSCVTDPPYALVSIVKRFGKNGSAPAQDGASGVYKRASAGFMGQQWDTGETAFDPDFWAEVWRVLKPGAHLLAFSGTRTYHRMVCAIEDAGFEIRDQIGWAYGSGFPKSHDVSKAIDKSLGAKRETIRIDAADVRNPKATGAGRDGTKGATRPWIEEAMARGYHEAASDEAASDEAAEWQGWGTALKPAWEPIVVARKPLIGTVAANVMAHGTGALNIDGCRVATEEDQRRPSRGGDNGLNGTSTFKIRERRIEDQERALGRWPANLVHDGSPEVLACFPDAGGGYGVRGTSPNWGPASGDGGTLEQVGFGDAGSAARFFYTAKADASDRLGSKHPTVKPVDLMRWLCRLVTPPGGTVLDPFAGSGTTGMACMAEGFDALLIEREANFVEDIKRRIAHVKGEDAPLFASEVA